MKKTQKTILIAGLCFYVSAASAQIGTIANVGTTATNLDAIAFNSSGVLYGATSGAGSLYTINPVNGVTTLVHTLVGVSNASLTYGLTGIAFQPGTGTLYGSTSPDSPNSGNSLVTINPSTGQVTVIGATGTGRPYTDISFAPNGTLYGWLIGSGATTISAATINLTTGAGTSLGSPQTPAALPDGGGLAVDAAGVIYVAANGHVAAPCSPTQNCSGAFWTINPANGAPTTIGTLTGGPGSAPTITALAFSPTGVLYGIEGGDGGASWNLVTISLGQASTNPPRITTIVSAASQLQFNSPIAPGSIFVIYGTGLGPDTISIAPAAFQSTTLSGTSVAVTVGSTTVNALMYYTSATQVAALLPSNTPVGGASFTVTYNKQTSNAGGHGLAASNPGIFTVDSKGTGPGIVTYPDYSLVSAAKGTPCGGPSTACGAANPGDTLILWATGLGPVNGSDADGAGLGQDMPNIPLTVWLGGVKAPVVYQGRSGCCIGEDQIVFTVPDNVPTGCAVPLVLQVGTAANTVSNSTVMPVSKESRTCTPANAALASGDIQQAVAAGPVSFGVIELGEFRKDGGGFEDEANFAFGKILSYSPANQPFLSSWFDDPPLGTCSVYPSLFGGGDPPGFNPVGIDGGSNATVNGPAGTATVAVNANSFNGNLSPAGTFLIPGSYTITGAGGADVGPFSAKISFPASPTLVTPQNNATVTRADGMTVTWTGGIGNMKIQVRSATDGTYNLGSRAVCTVPATAGTFTIPPYVLLALPAGNFAGIVVSPVAEPVPFTAKGLTVGILQTNHDGFGYGYGAGTGSFTLR